MSRRDFEICTPDEFAAIWKAWFETQQRRERSGWERTRMQCLCMLQPYSGKTLKPSDVMSFPWDDESVEVHDAPAERLTRDQELEAYRQAKAAAGLK